MSEAKYRGSSLSGLLSAAPFFAELWYGRFANLVLTPVMTDPDADVAAAIRRAMPAMQAVADTYWAGHEHFVQGGGTP